ncbi:MAG TPA: DUF533 domain-containing protein [Kofleriaceae bacterium]|nr:DUF533 domain-containing protein [Kofleriaceae bacterium]
MAESQILSVIRIWAAVAWADGVMSPSEADSLERLIQTADLTEAERASARSFVQAPTELPERYLAELTQEARRGVYRAACRMAMVDRVLSATERALLERVRSLLGLSADLARELEASVPGLSTG